MRQLVRVFALQPQVDQRQHDALRENQPFQTVQVVHHIFGIDQQLFDNARQTVQTEIQPYHRIGGDNAFVRRMGNVAFVPQSDVFHRGNGVRAQQPRQSRQIFGQHGVALVRHGGRSLLSRGKVFFGFADFGTLQVADFNRQTFNRRRDDADGREQNGVAVAGNDLGRNGFGGQAQFFRDVLFDTRVNRRKSADRARNRASGNFFARQLQAVLVAFEFGVKAQHFQPERRRFCVNAVTAPDAKREFVFFGAFFQRRQQPVHVFEQNVDGLSQAHVERRVQNVRRRHALVHVTRAFADVFADVCQKRDDVVFDFGFDFVDALGVEFAFGADVVDG